MRENHHDDRLRDAQNAYENLHDLVVAERFITEERRDELLGFVNQLQQHIEEADHHRIFEEYEPASDRANDKEITNRVIEYMRDTAPVSRDQAEQARKAHDAFAHANMVGYTKIREREQDRSQEQKQKREQDRERDRSMGR